MTTIQEAAQTFLNQQRLAVVGVSRHGDVAANVIYKRLRGDGYEVFPVNPNATAVEGDRCYESLSAIPGGVDAVVIATPPEVTAEVVQECGEIGVDKVWIHRSFGQGSLSEKAVELCRELGISVIPGSCPMMFCEPVDVAHKCFRWMQNVSGGQAKPIGF